MKRTPCVLLIGFEPFAGETINPSAEVVRALDGAVIGGHRVVGAAIAVTFASVSATISRLLAQHRPTLVIALGQAGGRSAISFERVAINLIDARIADNEGCRPIDEPIIADAPAAYFSTLPVKAMHAALDAAGIACELSLSAGSYVCNQTFFVLAHLANAAQPTLRSGFVHVPWLPDQAANQASTAGMPLATMVRGIRIAIETALTTHTDARIVGGATH